MRGAERIFEVYWQVPRSPRWQLVARGDRPASPVFQVTSRKERHAPSAKARRVVASAKRAVNQQADLFEQIAHLSRVAVLGELSGAFAHELAQPLTPILANAEAALQIALRDVTVPVEIPELLRDIISDNVRAAESIERLRSLLKRGEVCRECVDLNQVVRDVLALLRSDLIERNVSAITLLAPQTPFVLADRILLQQVLLNLVMNACEAMSHIPRTERRLTIATRAAEECNTVECSVTDRGPGVPAHSIKRIFEPFVTTKRDGLGLGLAICTSIIEALGGCLWAENATERGAIFQFTVERGSSIDRGR